MGKPNIWTHIITRPVGICKITSTASIGLKRAATGHVDDEVHQKVLALSEDKYAKLEEIEHRLFQIYKRLEQRVTPSKGECVIGAHLASTGIIYGVSLPPRSIIKKNLQRSRSS